MSAFFEYSYSGKEIDQEVNRWANTFSSEKETPGYYLYLAQTLFSDGGLEILETIVDEKDNWLSFSEKEELMTLAEGMLGHSLALAESSESRAKVVDIRSIFGPVIFPSALEIVLKLADGEVTAKSIEKQIAEDLGSRVLALINFLNKIEKAWTLHLEALKEEDETWEESLDTAQAFVPDNSDISVLEFTRQSTQVVKEQKHHVSDEKRSQTRLLRDLKGMKSWLGSFISSVSEISKQPINLTALGKPTAMRMAA